MKRIILVLLVAACFGQNGLHDFAPSLGRGLNVNVVGGVAAISTVPTAIAGTSVGVAANTTTYIYVDLSAAIISSNTSGFTSTEYPVATVVTNSTQIVTLTDDRPGAYAVSGGGGSGTVSSVSNSDGTLTITPTTGAVIAALALAHANTWTGQQTFVAPILGTPASGIITNLTGTCTSCTSNLAVNISTNGTANQVWGMNSGASAQGWQSQIFSSLTTTGTSGAATLSGGVLNIPQYSGSGGLPSGLSFTSPTLTISSATNGNGALALSGNTSGTATLTAPAIAGTASNPIASTNVFTGPDTSSQTEPTWGFSDSATTGIGEGAPGSLFANATNINFAIGGVTKAGITSAGNLSMSSAGGHLTSNATGNDRVGTCTMSSGACTAITFTTAYTSAPACQVTWTGAGTLTGLLSSNPATTGLQPKSSVLTDTAVVAWLCFGNAF
jgi:hypothetical protein